MNTYDKDIETQLKIILKKFKKKQVLFEYYKEIEKIFKNIYAINYLKNRIELYDFVQTEYFNITFSCLLESFALLLDNHSRGACLVLRSAIENYIKHIIESANNNYNFCYVINDRIYTQNHNTLLNNSDELFSNDFIEESESIISKLETHYKKLSGISHSLTEESKKNMCTYFSDLDNTTNLIGVINRFLDITDNIFTLMLISCEPSLRKWVASDINNILKIVYGARRRKKFIKRLGFDVNLGAVAVTK